VYAVHVNKVYAEFVFESETLLGSTTMLKTLPLEWDISPQSQRSSFRYGRGKSVGRPRSGTRQVA